MSPETITLQRVSDVLTPHLPVYRWRRPVYQTAMLQALAGVWEGGHRRVLDLGGGTGVIAEAVQALFPGVEVSSVDVEDRYLPGLSVASARYEGTRLPFEDGAFDAVMTNNVLHHVPEAIRAPLLRECRRVAPTGPLYIKDHLAASALDHRRLAVLDWIGNVPFKGMLWARYLSEAQWDALARDAGYLREVEVSGPYRSGPMAAAFPNRLEVTMRWRPLAVA